MIVVYDATATNAALDQTRSSWEYDRPFWDDCWNGTGTSDNTITITATSADNSGAVPAPQVEGPLVAPEPLNLRTRPPLRTRLGKAAPGLLSSPRALFRGPSREAGIGVRNWHR